MFIVTELMERGSLARCLQLHTDEFAWERLGRKVRMQGVAQEANGDQGGQEDGRIHNGSCVIIFGCSGCASCRLSRPGRRGSEKDP